MKVNWLLWMKGVPTLPQHRTAFMAAALGTYDAAVPPDGSVALHDARCKIVGAIRHLEETFPLFI